MDFIIGLFGFGMFLFIAFVILSIPVSGLSKVTTYHLARALTPAAQKRYGDIQDSEGNKSLKADGYSVTVDWSMNAVASLMKARNK